MEDGNDDAAVEGANGGFCVFDPFEDVCGTFFAAAIALGREKTSPSTPPRSARREPSASELPPRLPDVDIDIRIQKMKSKLAEYFRGTK